MFDDIQGGFKYFPAYKSWLGQQAEFYCTDKFRKKKYIKWGRPCIWIMNEDPYTQEVDIDWLEKIVSLYILINHYSNEIALHANNNTREVGT